MKKYLVLPLIAALLLTTSIFISCSAKEQTSTPATAEAPTIQDSEKVDGSDALKADLKDKPRSPEAEMADKSPSPEAELRDRPRAPEADTGR